MLLFNTGFDIAVAIKSIFTRQIREVSEYVKYTCDITKQMEVLDRRLIILVKIVFFNEKRNNKPVLKRVRSLKTMKTVKTRSNAVFLSKL